VAQRLTELLRPGDIVARLGGDEFVVLVNELGQDRDGAAHAAMAVAERVRRIIESPSLIDGWLYSGAGSVGVTMFPKGQSSVDDLLREADTAMYRAKETGRNRIAYFEAAMQAEVEERLALENDLKEALDTAQITVSIQPQVNLARQQVGGELLLRWNHPHRGAVSPAVFIPVAEESGLILRLGDFVLRRACESVACLARAGRPHCLSVNISPRQFRQEDFVAKVKSVLQQTQAPATQIIFEVTEGLLIEDWQDVADRMTELARLGIRFSIDDFGTGYSSLAYLKKLPLHEIKVDKSFVQDTPDDPNDTAIVHSILAMAKHFRLQVVAEGVETDAQAAFLAGLQCDLLQGFLFARPEPLDGWLDRVLPERAADPVPGRQADGPAAAALNR
jgi:predicted signal transduction protein with EAL and GGDEF domain